MDNTEELVSPSTSELVKTECLMIHKEVLLQFMEQDDLLKEGTPRNRILKLCFGETMGSWTAVRPDRKPALDAIGRGLGGGKGVWIA
jgi:hypothetical protein